MAGLAKLEISSFRNIKHCVLAPHPEINLLAGPNASGKTSFLEAIHYLAQGRSFRASGVKPLIRVGDHEMVLYAETAGGSKSGLRKTRAGDQTLKLDGKALRSWENIAREIPVQLLDATSFSLLTEGPSLRRRFLDWGVFHVEQRFLADWRRARKALMHRNALLKTPGDIDKEQIRIWEEEFAAAAVRVTDAREQYFQRLRGTFSTALHSLDEELGDAVGLHFQAGWNRDHELARLLFESRESDRSHGATRPGPHRADMLVKVGGDRAINILSRGQQKLVVSALKVAQGEQFFAIRQQRPIYLVDDLAAELDGDNRVKVFGLLRSLGAQLFVTGVDAGMIDSWLSEGMGRSLFHVEHGRITA